MTKAILKERERIYYKIHEFEKKVWGSIPSGIMRDIDLIVCDFDGKMADKLEDERNK